MSATYTCLACGSSILAKKCMLTVCVPVCSLQSIEPNKADVAEYWTSLETSGPENATLRIPDSLLPVAFLMLVTISAVALCRDRLRHFTAGIWTSGPTASGPASSPTSAHQNHRADTSSPDIEIALDRDSDDSADGANQGRAQMSNPDAISPKTASMLACTDTPTHAEGQSSYPESHSPGTRSCSPATRQSHSTARPNDYALPLRGFSQTPPQTDEQNTAPVTTSTGEAAAAAQELSQGDRCWT